MQGNSLTLLITLDLSYSLTHSLLPSDVILSEMYRITAPKGVVAITDNNPKSPVIQNLPPVLFTLMKSTEPHSDQYYSYDVESAMRRAGFTEVTTIATDPRHRTIIGKKWVSEWVSEWV